MPARGLEGAPRFGKDAMGGRPYSDPVAHRLAHMAHGIGHRCDHGVQRPARGTAAVSLACSPNGLMPLALTSTNI